MNRHFLVGGLPVTPRGPRSPSQEITSNSGKCHRCIDHRRFFPGITLSFVVLHCESQFTPRVLFSLAALPSLLLNPFDSSRDSLVDHGLIVIAIVGGKKRDLFSGGLHQIDE